MRDTADSDAPGFDPPDADRVYCNNLETCHRLGVTSTPQDRAKALIKEWTDAMATDRSVPPITH